MVPVPVIVMNDYVAMLRAMEIAPGHFEHYKKWLRYFYDFSEKHLAAVDKPERVKKFLEKLRSKNQSSFQCQQAAHAISLYFEMQYQKEQPEKSDDEFDEEHKHIVVRQPSAQVLPDSLNVTVKY